MKKYFAKRPVTIDGRLYNIGEIVMTDRLYDGLEMAQDQGETVTRKTAKKSNFLTDGSPEISVIITFHNQERFARRCVESFWQQTIRVPFEIIAVVDKSEEREESVIKAFCPLARVFKTDAGNACVARNKGIDNARGKYLAFFDGDDWVESSYLEELYRAIQEHDADFSYARMKNRMFGFNKGNLPRCNVLEWGTTWQDFSPVTNTPLMIKKEKAPRWDERLEIMQDVAYSLDMKELKGIHVWKELWNYDDFNGVWNRGGVKEKRAFAQELLEREKGLRTDEAEVTFVSLISRDEVLAEYFAQIPSLKIPKKAHWFIIIDSNDRAFVNKVRGLIEQYAQRFLSYRIFVTGEDSLATSRDFEARGMRIARIIKTIINQVGSKIGGTPFLFMVEDDTLAPKGVYPALMKQMKPDMAYMSGIECGRGFTKHTGVCWLKTDEKGEIIGREIPKMKEKGVLEIEGGGWYCWIGRISFLKDYIAQRNFRCLDGKMLGPDVMMVYDLRQMGYMCKADLSLQCKHYDSRRKVWLDASEGKGYDIKYVKQGGMWTYQLTEKV